MSGYVITQKQLDFLQQHIKYLQKLNDAKDEKIKALLEVPTGKNSVAKTTVFLTEKKKLENEINELRTLKEQLVAEIEVIKNSDNKIKELEILLNEERKLRQYSESFAQQVELKCAEESLIRDLITELCQLQKDEIEIENKQILDLKKKYEALNKEMNNLIMERKKENEKSWTEIDSKESFVRDINLKSIESKLQDIKLHSENLVVQNQTFFDTSEEQQVELQSWLEEIDKVMDNLNDIKEIKKDLNYLKSKIENKKKMFCQNEVTYS